MTQEYEGTTEVVQAAVKSAAEFGEPDREVASLAASLNSLETAPSSAVQNAQISNDNLKQKDDTVDEDDEEDDDDGGYGFFNPDLFTSNVEYELSEFKFPREDGSEDELVVKLSYLHGSNQLIEKFVSRVVWPSAEELSRHFALHPEIVASKNILELGSGTGLCGISMACLGATSVVLTDYNEASVELLQENIDLNSVGDICSTSRLVWGDEQSCAAILQGLELSHFDLVVGTDVVYEPECIEPLLQSARAFMNKNPQSKFILANHTHRYGNYAELVHETAAALGFIEEVQPPFIGEEGQIDFSIFTLPKDEESQA
mmetsp:Transcript_17733/g.34956  ORF Transcript_17733/g.34956 Transcript_17733/m.34956 type:complete len:316 (+) Transcript_17733:173-1120(+)|eukprot:CAMPEP_0171489070 /NCGR_PEP_ID=MMETSP0958-20121227/2549_1 /TAXON_ID=87120 /ORGANISM="Aurantiochytrium limacinum, Strain ATCCMYA-1381" /LENGTH=315 /DNA_ID=CAMNT_0012022235 /DNA_START=102 /DNA_END=1049 /DNA_ORIENTATION=+